MINAGNLMKRSKPKHVCDLFNESSDPDLIFFSTVLIHFHYIEKSCQNTHQGMKKVR